MYRQDFIGGVAEYLFPVTVRNPDYGRPLDDPAYRALKRRHKGRRVKFVSFRRASSLVELLPAFPGERVIATKAHDNVIRPASTHWDAGKGNKGNSAMNAMGWESAVHGPNRCLMKFDLSGFPRSTRILGAQIRLTLVQGKDAAPTRWQVFGLRRPWNETRQPDGRSCWYGPKYPNVKWAAKGCDSPQEDRYPEVAAEIEVARFPRDEAEKRRLIAFDVSDLARKWHSGRTPNHGIIIKIAGPIEEHQWVNVCSNEFQDYPLRPTLVVAYEGADPRSLVGGTPPPFPGSK